LILDKGTWILRQQKAEVSEAEEKTREEEYSCIELVFKFERFTY
jgi:hypothetical protein